MGAAQSSSGVRIVSSSLVTITDRARAVLAFDAELQEVERQIRAEQDRHDQIISVLAVKRQALEQAILKLGAN